MSKNTFFHNMRSFHLKLSVKNAELHLTILVFMCVKGLACYMEIYSKSSVAQRTACVRVEHKKDCIRFSRKQTQWELAYGRKYSYILITKRTWNTLELLWSHAHIPLTWGMPISADVIQGPYRHETNTTQYKACRNGEFWHTDKDFAVWCACNGRIWRQQGQEGWMVWARWCTSGWSSRWQASSVIWAVTPVTDVSLLSYIAKPKLHDLAEYFQAPGSD